MPRPPPPLGIGGGGWVRGGGRTASTRTISSHSMRFSSLWMANPWFFLLVISWEGAEEMGRERETGR